MFAPQDCAILPVELVAELADSGGFRDVTHVTDPEVRALLDGLSADPDEPTYRCTNGKTDYWTYIQEAIWSMSSDDEDQQSYLKSSSLVSP
jgi:hypothetical protein